MVIGGGAAGLNGALILARSPRSVVVIDSGSPRNAPAKAVQASSSWTAPRREILRRGREQVRQYGGRVVHSEVVAAESAAPSADGDLRFTVTLADGRSSSPLAASWSPPASRMCCRRYPGSPGTGARVVHCPYCHGWEVRDEPIGVLATGRGLHRPRASVPAADQDLAYFTHGTDLDEDSRARFAARSIRILDTPVTEVVNDEDGASQGCAWPTARSWPPRPRRSPHL